ncbi:DMT family transporter [Mycobacterium sp. 236(2023)]|uniref:DMT family transporter n=1 Tax=Mycobacterium sp. 236(2023) TaxID=3038163 RepID=UPI002414E43C|nr:DMT family transporter [Mycobacterium sp. 236(2023)]MDG4663763.1 DMT family transporter [Mycobacterium sp. 236(2023)]
MTDSILHRICRDRHRPRTRDVERPQPRLLRGTSLYLTIAVVGLVHGLNWPVMAHGVTLMPPEWLAAFRLGVGGIVAAVAMAGIGKLHRPVREDLPVVISVGVLQLAVVYALMFVALTQAPAGRSAVLLHTSALWAVPIAALFLRERYSMLTVAGLVAGICGVVLLLAPWEDGFFSSTRPFGYGLLLAGAAINAAVTVHIRSHRWTGSPLELLPWQLGIGCLAAATYAWASAGPPLFGLNWQVLLVVLYQGVFASAIGVWGVLAISRSLGAVSSNLSLMVVPVLGLLSSAVFLAEGLPFYVLLGLATILVGAAMGITATRASPTPADPLG